MPALRGVHAWYLQFGTVSKPCLSYGNMFICFCKIVLFCHRQSKEHTASSARSAVTIIITFTMSADILFVFPVQMSCIMEYIYALCALVSRNANKIQWTAWYLKRGLHFFNYSNFPSAIYKPGQPIAYLISPELALDTLLNYAKNNLVFY